jgi:hypothetical protein
LFREEEEEAYWPLCATCGRDRLGEEGPSLWEERDAEGAVTVEEDDEDEGRPEDEQDVLRGREREERMVDSVG